MILKGEGSSDKKSYERVDAGVYVGRCIRIVDLGTHEHTIFKNEDGTPQIKRELEIVWELSELMEDGRPFVVSWKGTYPQHFGSKSNLYKLLIAWRGRDFTAEELEGFNMKNLLDACAMINVSKVPNKKDPNVFYNNVMGVMPMIKGMAAMPRVNDLLIFDLDHDINDKEKIAALWPWQKKQIESSQEWEKFYEGGQPFKPEEQEVKPPF
jgi:hypothetical protein